MKAFTDFFPLIVFFAAYQYSKDIILATGTLIVATTLQVAFLWVKYRRVEKMHLITLALVVVFGGLTVLLKDDMFIKWKPTVINWLFAVVFLGSQFFGQKNVLQRMLDTNMDLPLHIWRNLNFAWVGFFVFSGALNLYVAFTFDQETWVNFKVFGLLGLTFAFVIIQGLLLSKYISEPETAEKETNNNQ
ncbi:MAG: septation protein A [Hahellaceae bacterium]|jgi:intracellular septation protein|nr:septation protein A [Hahellaceae bacterium]MCP5212055.1 septation protein A [Hahellaceae bacterium]